MKSHTHSVRRSLAAGVAGALVAGAAAAVVAAPASHAAPATGSFSWGISQNFVEHLFFSKAGPVLPTTPSGTLSGGVTHETNDPTTGLDDRFVFPAVSSSRAADGTVTSQYEGTVRGAFVNGGTEYYSVTISDPVVVVSGDGSGQVRADVSGSAPGVSTTPTEVTVVEFSSSSSTGGVLTATPEWEGVLPAGSATAVDLGIVVTTDPTTSNLPADGKSFNPGFLGAIPSTVRAHFYNSSKATPPAAQANKAPGAFTAEAVMVPTVTPTVLSESYEDGVEISVAGSGFNPSTNPGDQGVYVALAPADTVIDYTDQSSMSSMAAVDWVMPSRFSGDTFTANLVAPTDKLEIGESYALFTWQAHGHSNTTQDTTTPVTIDWSKFEEPTPTPTTPTPTTPAPTTPTPTTPAPTTPVVVKVDSTVTVKVSKKATLKKAGKAVVTVKGGDVLGTGTVVVKIKVAGVKKAKKVTVTLNAKGQAKIKLPKAKKKGAYKVVVTYAGDEKLNAAKKVVKKFKVKK